MENEGSLSGKGRAFDAVVDVTFKADDTGMVITVWKQKMRFKDGKIVSVGARRGESQKVPSPFKNAE